MAEKKSGTAGATPPPRRAPMVRGMPWRTPRVRLGLAGEGRGPARRA